LDTGASWNAINDPSLCIPGSIKPLKSPIVLDGIAGGLKIEKSGMMEVETLTKSGTVYSFQATVMIHESLPGVLLCPQALLKNERASLRDHFRIYHDRMEWHEKGARLLNIPYDNSFLP
jgi:hypothetical protein